MADYTRQLKKHLKKAECRLERQGRGDHEIWYSPITGVRFVVDQHINYLFKQYKFYKVTFQTDLKN